MFCKNCKLFAFLIKSAYMYKCSRIHWRSRTQYTFCIKASISIFISLCIYICEVHHHHLCEHWPSRWVFLMYFALVRPLASCRNLEVLRNPRSRLSSTWTTACPYLWCCRALNSGLPWVFHLPSLGHDQPRAILASLIAYISTYSWYTFVGDECGRNSVFKGL